MNPGIEGHEENTRSFLPILAGILLIGAVFRVLGLFNDFWLDEILTLRQALSLSSPLEIFSADLPVSNTPLNTLFLWALGEFRYWVPYRLFSTVTGIGSVALMGCIGQWFGWRAAIATTVAGGMNYLLILYSSEALGYSPAVFFSLASVLLYKTLLSGAGWGLHFLFWSCTIMGFLSHPVYLFVFIGLLAWHLFALLRQENGPGLLAIRFLRQNGPSMLFAWFYLSWYRGKWSYNAPPHSPAAALGEAISFTFGLPLHARWHAYLMALVGLCIIVVFLAEVRRLQESDEPFWGFLLATVSIAPAAAIGILKPTVFYPRYFIVCVPFLLIAVSLWVVRLYEKGFGHRIASVVILLLYCAGNLVHIGGLLKHGRGGYSEALTFMVSHSRRTPTSVASNDDWRCRQIISFYVRALSIPLVRFQQIAGDLGQVEAEWLIRTDPEPQRELASAIKLPGGAVYELVKQIPSCELSGFWWALYRVTDSPEICKRAVPMILVEDSEIGLQSIPR